MTTDVSPETETENSRLDFLKAIFTGEDGFIACQAIAKPTASTGGNPKVTQAFFSYPEEVKLADDWVEANHASKNVYFSPMLYSEKRRVKNSVKTCTCVWADMDGSEWESIDPTPSIVVESSPGHFHMYWLLAESAEPAYASEASKRVAYKYKAIGMDTSGWDLSQLLRMPDTFNLKYITPESTPVTKLVKFEPWIRYDIDNFLANLPPTETVNIKLIPFPTQLSSDTGEEILKAHEDGMPREALKLYEEVPTDDWSTPLWKLECLCAEYGLTREETFIVCRDAACNKFARDNRPEKHLWNDVCKAYDSIKQREKPYHEYITESLPATVKLMSDAERESVTNDYFIDQYTQWAKELTDADESFHHLSAFVVLSLILGQAIRVRTNVDDWRANIYALIMADTTLARKSTSMRLAMRLVNRIVPDTYIASDGSPEGIAEALSARQGKPSLMLRDEFSGMLLKMKNEHGYQSNLMQFLTDIYDGFGGSRRLSRGREITITDPVVVFFAGGVKSKILEVATPETVNSGFFPRFIFAVSNKSDNRTVMSLRPKTRDDNKENALVILLEGLHAIYNDSMVINLPNGKTLATPKIWYVEGTDETWDRYDQLLTDMIAIANRSPFKDVLEPVMERLAGSILKCAALLATSQTNPPPVKGPIICEVKHLLKVLSYAEGWAKNAIEICTQVGFTASERQMDKIWSLIQHQPGVNRSTVMRNFRLTSREADIILDTLEQRSMIVRKRSGKHEKLYTPGEAPVK